MAFSIKNLFTRASPEDPSVPLGSWIQIFGLGSGSKKMDAESALSISAVQACVRIIGETIGGLHKGVYEKLENGDIREAKDHPLYPVINSSPNILYNSFTYFEACASQIALSGNTYSKINYSKGEIQSLELVDDLEPFVKNGKKFYKESRTAKVYKDSEILHIPALTYDGIKGYGPLQLARETLLMSRGAKEYGQKLYENGAFLSGVIETDEKLSNEAIERVRKSWQQTYGGESNAGKTAILEEGMKFKPLRLNPIDAAFVETSKFQVEEIARMFRIPLHLIGHLERSTNNNIEQQSIDFVMHTVRPYVKRFETELNRKLFTSEEKNYFIRFNIDSLLRGDMKSRAEFYKTLHMMGSLNANEIRAYENLNSIEGGDTYYVPVNMVESDKLNDNEE